jgi:histidyl-tRNA synthetase
MNKKKNIKEEKKKTTAKEIKFSENIIPAMYFGFKIKEPVEVINEDLKITKALYKEKGFLHDNLFPIEEMAANLRYFKERDTESMSPLLMINEGVSAGPHNKHRKKTGEEIINLHIIGVETSIAEALAIKTTEAILHENGYKNVYFKINDLGGKSAQTKYLKEGTNYFRKYIINLTPDDRQLFKNSLHCLITESKNIEDELFQNAPKPMDFLGDETRKNLSELLEFLEALETPHEINSFLLGDPNYSSDTIFEVSDENTGKVLGYGTRYDLLSKKIGMRKDIPALSVMIRVKKGKTASPKKIKKLSEPVFFLIQVGYTAKIKALKIIDDLRKAGIPVKHAIYRDKLSSQIIFAKKYEHGYDLIIGHKESIENCVIVRDSQGRSQKTVKIPELVEYLKSLK